MYRILRIISLHYAMKVFANCKFLHFQKLNCPIYRHKPRKLQFGTAIAVTGPKANITISKMDLDHAENYYDQPYRGYALWLCNHADPAQ